MLLPDHAKPDLDTGLALLGHTAFRPGQREAVEVLLDQGRLLLVAPTGGGKSLVYQLPALLFEGTTLVVSPLIALMQDQVEALESRGVAATFLAATLEADELRRRTEALSEGRYRIAYVSPERLGLPGFRRRLEALSIPLVAVDEAHCISEWGHDFRPEYLQLGELLEQLSPPRVLACTATATPVVRDEILSRLGLGADTAQRVHGFARPNLGLRATEVRSGRERAPLVDAQLAEALGGAAAPRGAAIVYAGTRRRSEEEAARLRAAGWRAEAYHAGLDGETRTRVQRAFMDGTLDVVAATNAFGMGIDRSDVRAVIHLVPPGSIEAYYQEVGRAGRDAEPAWGLLLTSPSDLPQRRRLIEGDAADGDPGVVEHKWNLFLELMRWAEGGACRHDAILRYFGDEAETLEGCGRCDNCTTLDAGAQDHERATLLVRKALSGVARVHDRFGLSAAVKLLRGVEDERLARAGLTTVSTYGVLRDEAEPFVQALLRRCVTAGWVVFSSGDRPVVRLTEDGRAVMKGERPARLVLPASTPGRSPAPPGTKRRRSEMDVETLDDDAACVFEALRQHRLEQARSRRVPPYVIASDRTLREIAVLRPTTLADLLQAHGVGPSKAEQYGPGWLATVRDAQAGGSGVT